MLVWIPETMAKARAPTAVILDMFAVILSLAGAVGWRQSGQFGLIRLIQSLTLAPLARVEAWPGSGYFDNENNPSKISPPERWCALCLVQIPIWDTEARPGTGSQGLVLPLIARSLRGRDMRSLS